jgi:hypothetical protein
MESDETYCRRRAIEEQAAARKASSASARERHEEMADMYRLRAEMLTPHAAASNVGDAVAQEVDLLAD